MGNHTYKLLSRIDFPVLVRVLSNYYYVFEYVVKKTNNNKNLCFNSFVDTSTFS